MPILQVLMALLIVLCLIVLVTLGVRWLKQNDRFKLFSSKRLAIRDRIPLDNKRSLVILQCDDREYVVLLGLTQETVLGEISK